MSKKVLVTGANGFIGRATCAALADRNTSVRRAVRTLTPESSNSQPIGGLQGVNASAQEIFEVGDISDSTDWAEALDGINVVIHLAAHVHVMDQSSAKTAAEFHRVNTLGTARLAASAVTAGVRRFIYLSTVGVNGRSTDGPSFTGRSLVGRSSTGRPFTETDDPHPEDAYALSKWEAEKELHSIASNSAAGNSALEVVILRPPLVYGPGEPGNFMRLVRLIDSGLPLPFGSIRARRSLIYVRNLVHAIIACAEHPRASGQIFLVSDGEEVSTVELIQSIARALGRRATLVPFWPDGLKIVGKLAGRSKQLNSLLASLVIDSARIREQLAWSPPYFMADGIQETVDWYVKRGRERSSLRATRRLEIGP